ncbi:MAG: hypothetical protein FJW95_03555 [Actinobacteria bacterium]|nr:hypothetical protein [Actinomycetota bacterium]
MNRSRTVTLVGAFALLLAALVLAVVVFSGGGAREPKTFRYVIPAGTGDRVAAGEDVEIVPARLVVRVGDRLLLRNKDDVQHHMGPLLVDPNGLLSMSFSDEGTLEGVCTLNESGQAKIIVKS